MSTDNTKNLYNTLYVTYTKVRKNSVYYRSINNSKYTTSETLNPCIRGIFVSNEQTACGYAGLKGNTEVRKLHKYIVVHDVDIVNINWENIKSIITFIKNIDILVLRNSVSITSRDAIKIIKKYLTFNLKDKKKLLMLNPVEVITINNINNTVAYWFSNIMAYLGFNGYLIDYGYKYAKNISAEYPPEIYFCFPRIQLKYCTKAVKCNKIYSNFEPL